MASKGRRTNGSKVSPQVAALADQNAHKLGEMISSLQTYQEEMRAQNEQLMDAQRTVEESRDRYAELYEKAPVGYLTLDRNGIVEQSNQAAVELLGVRRQAILRRPLLVFIFAEDRQLFLNHMLRSRNLGAVSRCELRLVRHDGSLVSVEVVTVPLQRPRLGGNVYLTTLLDVTDRRLAEDRRRRVEEEKQSLELREKSWRASSEAKDRFLAVLSHELRTPLTPILAAVTALESDELPPELRSMVEMIRRNVEMEGRLIDDLLDVTRIVRNKLRLKFGTVDAHQALQDAARMLECELQERNLSLTLELNATAHHVWADAARLRQVVWNLLANAIKFTPGGGKIVIRSANEITELPGAPTSLRAAQAPAAKRPATAPFSSPRLLIEVSDTGVGIPADILPRLFRAFEQGESHRPGLGLGLSIVKGLVDAHGGSVEAHSEGPNKGTTFSILLPVVPAELESANQPSPGSESLPLFNPESSLPPLRILLVEDHQDTSRIMARLLRGEGHQVSQAHTRAEALRLAEEPFDFLISDIGLPDGSGLDLIREIRSRQIQAPAIALSGFGTDEDIERSRIAGFNEHLTKPVDIHHLMETMHRLAPAVPVAR